MQRSERSSQILFGYLPFSLQLTQDGRADERTRTADLVSLRVIGQALQGAVRCVRRTRVVIRCRFDGATQTFPSG
jgi:hypothetical protein